MRRLAPVVLLLPLVLAAGPSPPDHPTVAHAIFTGEPPPARSASSASVDWCGAGTPPVVDRKPEADYSSFQHVHVTYVVPADAPSRFAELASAIATDLAAADAWWQREDPTRTIRFDRYAFPGCASKLGTLDLGFLRLPRPAATYVGDDGIVTMIPELAELAELSFQKNVVYYDATSPYDPSVCGTTLVPRASPEAGGLGGIAFIWLRSLCGQDVGTGRLNAEVVTHELVHGLGFIGRDGSPNECPAPNRGHVCDSRLDILHPEATLETTLAEKRLDVNRDDYYAHGQPFPPDLRASRYLSRLPQRLLSIQVATDGRGFVRLTSPAAYECRDECSLPLDDGLRVTLIAEPSRGSRLVRWSGACLGAGPCYVTLDGQRSVEAVFGPARFRLRVSVAGTGAVASTPAGIACPSRCSAAFRADARVRLRARAAPGYRFARWTGSCRARGACIVRLDRDRAVKVTFRRRD